MTQDLEVHLAQRSNSCFLFFAVFEVSSYTENFCIGNWIKDLISMYDIGLIRALSITGWHLESTEIAFRAQLHNFSKANVEPEINFKLHTIHLT